MIADFSGDFLVTEDKGRLMLRGFFYWPIAEGRYFTFMDIAPFIKQIIYKSYDLYIMPDVPEAKQKFGKLHAFALLSFKLHIYLSGQSRFTSAGFW
jgi:hypothetical protein